MDRSAQSLVEFLDRVDLLLLLPVAKSQALSLAFDEFALLRQSHEHFDLGLQNTGNDR